MDAPLPKSDPAGTAKAIRPSRDRRVFVEDLELIGQVGVYEHERRHKQRIVVSIDLIVADTYDGSDDLSAVYDYDVAIDIVRRVVMSGHFNLIETLAETIAVECLADARVRTVKIRIAKPDVLPACRSVGIEVERTRA